MSIVLLGATSGSVTLAEPAVGGSTTINIPAVSGTMAVLPTATGVLAEASGGTGTAVGYTGFKNRIINGAMAIDQRNAGAIINNAGSGAGAYTLDRFVIFENGSMAFSVQQTPSTTETGYAVRVAAGFQNYLAVTTTTGASPGTDVRSQLYQSIEGYNIADFAWGTASAKTVTLSFWVRSSLTGQFGGTLQGGAGQSYPFIYTISAANTWEQKSITVPGATAGTWVVNNNAGLTLVLDLGGGSNLLSPTSGAWVTADYRGVTGDTKISETTGATFYITGVQLEKGSTATAFDFRPYGTELALCQRYYEKSYDIGTAIGTSSAGIVAPQITTTNYYNNGLPRWMVEKRATPTVVIYNSNTGTVNSLYNTDSGANVTISSLTGVNTKGYQYIYSSAAVASAGQRLEYHYTVSAEL